MTRRLLFTARSPFARKVRIVLAEKRLECELVEIDLQNRSAEFIKTSPLGKVPVLIEDDETVVFDSSVIVDYLEDRYPTPRMLGLEWRERLLNRALDELADTLADNAISAYFAVSRGEPIARERALALAQRALGELDRRAAVGEWPTDFSSGDAAVISALGYFELRLGRELLAPFTSLRAQAERHAMRPSVASTVPKG